MYRIRDTKVVQLMQGSLNSSMGEHLMANNKLAYSGHQTLPITPDGIPSGAPAVREALSDPQLRDLRVLRNSIFYPCNPCVAEGDPCLKFLFSVVPARHRPPEADSGEAGGSVPPWFDDPPKQKLHLTSWRKQ